MYYIYKVATERLMILNKNNLYIENEQVMTFSSPSVFQWPPCIIYYIYNIICNCNWLTWQLILFIQDFIESWITFYTGKEELC